MCDKIFFIEMATFSIVLFKIVSNIILFQHLFSFIDFIYILKKSDLIFRFDDISKI